MLQWPTCCACCLPPHDDFLKVKHYHRTNTGGTQGVAMLAILAFKGKAALEEALPYDSWKVPYCWDCLEHVKSKDEEEMHKDRKSTRLNSSHLGISYAVFCLKKT